MSVYDYAKYTMLSRELKRLLLEEFGRQGVEPPSWLDDMAELVAADLVMSGRVGRRSVEEAVRYAVAAWRAVLEDKRVAEQELKWEKRVAKGGKAGRRSS